MTEVQRMAENNSGPFDGPIGWVAAKVMAYWNVKAETEAVSILAPVSGETKIVIGFGSGIGIKTLSLHQVKIVRGAPSLATIREASRRNSSAISAGNLQLIRSTINDFSWPADSFDGAVAVHSIQMFEPLADSARVLEHFAR